MEVRTVILAAWALATLACASACHRSENDTSVIGSTSIQPFAEMLAEEFKKVKPDRSVEIQGMGSKVGLEAVKNNLADIGMCSRDLKLDDPDEALCVPVVIAYDGLAIVVHPDNPIRKLERWQVALIFSGDITNWKDVGGDDLPIHVITREEGSGTREAFVKLVMQEGAKHLPKPLPDGVNAEKLMHNKGRIFTKAVTQESNGAVMSLVRHDHAGIGYMSLGLVTHDSGLAALDVDGVTPTRETVRSGVYKLKRPFLFVFHKDRINDHLVPDGARAFTEYVLSDAGQDLLEREGLVSVPEKEKTLPWATQQKATSQQPQATR